MRTTEKFIKLTLSEDRDHIRALVQAIARVGRSEVAMIKTLTNAKRWLVDENGELTPESFGFFRNVLDRLQIPRPVLKGGDERGQRYPIPMTEPGKSKALARRNKKRLKAWDAALTEFGLSETDVERILQPPGLYNEITTNNDDHEILAEGYFEMESAMKKLRKEIEEMRVDRRVEELTKEIEALRNELENRPQYGSNVIPFRAA